MTLREAERKLGETEKANRVDLMLRLLFDIDENKIAEQRVYMTIYVRITDPEWKSTKQCCLRFRHDKFFRRRYILLTTLYLKLLSLDTNNTPVNDVTVDWHQDNEYEPGDVSYTVIPRLAL